MNNSKKYLFLIVTILIVVIGVSLAYFGITIIGNDTAKGNKVVTGNLELTFTDTNEISLENAFPGDSFTKTISVKNTGTKEVSYNLVWTELNNEITNNELIIEATCKSLNSSGTEGGTCEVISQTPVGNNIIKKNISIEPNVTHEYNITITFIDTGKPQNYNKNKTFEGKLGINESEVKTVYCKYDGDLITGAKYVNGNFTYYYKQKKYNRDGEQVWPSINEDGWGMVLTNPNSTESIDTSEVCTYINGKPIVSMSGMFSKSQATSIELSTLDTSNVIYMDYMFKESKATTLDVSNFDTSKVTDMRYMFASSQATILDLSKFNTSKVTNMSGMFSGSQVTTLDLSSFNTSSIADMTFMFAGSQAIEIKGLENFNTSNVIHMDSMFDSSQVASLNLSNFDTSSAVSMNSMFNNSQATTLNLSNFDTSCVKDMTYMFSDSSKLKTIYVSDKFVVNGLIDSDSMFLGCTSLVGGAGTIYNEEYVDKTYAYIDGGEADPGYFTAK